MSFLSKFSRVQITLVFFSVIFLLFVGVVRAGTLNLQADYSCDNMTDLDDYTVLVKEKRLSTRKLSLMFKEWGKRGISDLPECEGKAVTSISDSTTTQTSNIPSNDEQGGTGGTTDEVADDTGTTDTDSSDNSVTINTAIDLTDTTLVAYFPMEEASGNLINKKVSNSQANLIPQGNVSYRQTGKLGKAVRVNGVGNAFCSGSGSSCSDVKLYDFTGDYTLGMWVKQDLYNQSFLFRKWEEGAGNYSYWMLDSNIFIAALSHPHSDWLFGYGHGPRKNMPTGRSFVEGFMELSEGDIDGWHHITVVRDTAAKTVYLYVDGVKQDTHPGQLQEQDGGIIPSEMRADNQGSSDPFRLGELNGLIDDFFAYDRALSEEEIKAIYQTGV